MFLIYIWNIRNKADLLHDYITRERLGAFLITESWLKDDNSDKAWIKSTALNSDQYIISTVNQQNKQGGGIALVCRCDFKS